MDYFGSFFFLSFLFSEENIKQFSTDFGQTLQEDWELNPHYYYISMIQRKRSRSEMMTLFLILTETLTSVQCGLVTSMHLIWCLRKYTLNGSCTILVLIIVKV